MSKAAQENVRHGKKNRTKTTASWVIQLTSAIKRKEIRKALNILSVPQVRKEASKTSLWEFGAPLHTAARLGRVKFIPILINSGFQVDALEKENGSKDTPLNLAASFQRLKAVEMLLKYGANPNKTSVVNKKGKSLNFICAKLMLFIGEAKTMPLAQAIYNDNVAIAKLLLKYGANPDITFPYSK